MMSLRIAQCASVYAKRTPHNPGFGFDRLQCVNFLTNINFNITLLKESSPVGSPSVGNSSINMGEEQDMDVDAVNKTGQGKSEIVELDSPVAKRQRVSENKQEVEEEEAGQEAEENVEAESENKTEANVEDKTQSIDRVVEETGDEPVTSVADKLVVLASVEVPKSIQNEEEEKEKRLREQKVLLELCYNLSKQQAR